MKALSFSSDGDKLGSVHLPPVRALQEWDESSNAMETQRLTCDGCHEHTTVERRVVDEKRALGDAIVCEHCGQELSYDEISGGAALDRGSDSEISVAQSAAQLLSSVEDDDDDEETIWLGQGEGKTTQESGSLRPHALETELRPKVEDKKSSVPSGRKRLQKRALGGRLQGIVSWSIAGASVFALGWSLFSLGASEQEVVRMETVAERSEVTVADAASPPSARLRENESGGEEAGQRESAPNSAFSLDEVLSEQEEESAPSRAENAQKQTAPSGETAAEDAPNEVEEEAPRSTAEFEEAAARAALSEAAVLASACQRAGDPPGDVRVVVTFNPSGDVAWAGVKHPIYSRSETGNCIASVFRSVSVPAFNLDRKTVSHVLHID